MAYQPVPQGQDQSVLAATPKFVLNGGRYLSSVITYTEDQAVIDSYDVNGNKKVTLATLIAGEDVTNNVMRVSVVGGQVQALQSGAWSTSVVGNVGITGNPSISGTVEVLQTGTWRTSIASGAFRADNADTVAASATVNNLAVISRSTVFNGTSWDRFRGDVNGIYISSIAAGAQALGKTEDAAAATGDVGVATWGVRNDTMSSITSADGDYSARTVGPVGETLVANAPITKWISGQTSVMYGVSVQAIAAQGASIFANGVKSGLTIIS